MEKKIDWTAIEHEYLTSEVTLIELANKYNVSKEALWKRAKRKGWKKEKESLKIDSEKILQNVKVRIEKEIEDKLVKSATEHLEEINAFTIPLAKLGLQKIGTTMQDKTTTSSKEIKTLLNASLLAQRLARIALGVEDTESKASEIKWINVLPK